ncbi:MAG: EamA family transporter [Spirochaetes bacterium]|nr:EamA family transporter [Spirochaetota bacterium]
MRERGYHLPLLGTAVALIWGLTFISTKVAVREIGPMSLALARFIIAVIALLPIVALTRTSLKVEKRDFPRLAAAGFLGITLYFLFENNGIMRLSASESSIIVGTIPVLTLLIEIFIYKRKTRTVVVVGILLSFLGVAGIVAKSETVKSNPVGYLYMIGAALVWVLYTFLTKPLGSRYSLLSVTFWQILFGMIGCIPFALAEGQDFSVVTLPVWLNIVFLGVLASALGYWFYVVVLDKMGPSRAAVFINLIPVVSIVASFFILGERLSPLQLVGGATAIAGVYLTTT